jgi:hypothetical protein
MGDFWKGSRWVLHNGDVLSVGHRSSVMTGARDVLDAEDQVPEHWKIARVMRGDRRVGFGIHRTLAIAKLAALYQAGHISPAPEGYNAELRSAHVDRQVKRVQGGWNAR